jgi:adenylate cyclase
MDRKLRNFLRKRGATNEEIEQADREGWLKLLVFDRAIMPGRPNYTFAESAQRAGIELKDALRLWRALGFPDPSPSARSFSDEDVDALRTLRRMMSTSIVPEFGDKYDGIVQQVRVIGGSLARIAEVQSDDLVSATRSTAEAGLSDGQIALLIADGLDWSRISRLVDYALRLQLRAAAWRKLAVEDPESEFVAAVGFVDLVGYTALSAELDEEELAALVQRFEELAYDTVAERRGRVVKTIGDEVMFVAEDPAAAARIALRLTERSGDDALLPEARAGLGYGPVLAHEGDYYGTTVNVARRVVDLARPGTAVTTDAVHAALETDSAFEWRRLRTRRIRDIGSVGLWQLRSVADTMEIPIVTQEPA